MNAYEQAITHLDFSTSRDVKVAKAMVDRFNEGIGCQCVPCGKMIASEANNALWSEVQDERSYYYRYNPDTRMIECTNWVNEKVR